MIPSVHTTTKLVLGMVLVLGAMLLGEARILLEVAKIAAAATGAYCIIWLQNEWCSFDEGIQEDCGAYIPEKEDTTAIRKEPVVSSKSSMPRVSSYSSLSGMDRDLWRVVLKTGAPI